LQYMAIEDGKFDNLTSDSYVKGSNEMLNKLTGDRPIVNDPGAGESLSTAEADHAEKLRIAQDTFNKYSAMTPDQRTKEWDEKGDAAMKILLAG
ncbi:MAG: hypothetical protein VXB01_11845, partial [Opitutae bacterium]